jgi:hypothetical protein
MPLLLQVLLDQDQGLQPVAALARERALLLEELAQGLTLVQYPGVQGREEGFAADEMQLDG